MITECYIKGRFDYGVGKCAVVITEDVSPPKEKTVLHQVAWTVPAQWQYNGETIKTDQQSCEITAACYAIQWCINNNKPLVNIYANTASAQKWYYRMDFPEGREALAKAYSDVVNKYYAEMNKTGVIDDRIYAEYIPKNNENIFNQLVNTIAESVK